MPTQYEIDQAVIMDNIIRPWANEGLRSGKIPQDVFQNAENRKWIDAYCKANGGFSTATLDAALAALLEAIKQQKKFQAAKEKLGAEIVHWFEAIRTRRDSLKYLAQSDRNWDRARKWFEAQTNVVLSISAWDKFVLDHEYDPGFWDWEVPIADLVQLIRSARSPLLEYGRLNGTGELRPIGGLLVQKFGRKAIDEAFDKFTAGVKRTVEGRYSAHDIESWRKNEEKKVAEARAHRQADPRLIEQMKRETENIVWLYRAGGNHAATARGRQQLQSVIDSGLASGKSWFEIHDEVQAEANRLAGL